MIKDEKLLYFTIYSPLYKSYYLGYQDGSSYTLTLSKDKPHLFESERGVETVLEKIQGLKTSYVYNKDMYVTRFFKNSKISEDNNKITFYEPSEIIKIFNSFEVQIVEMVKSSEEHDSILSNIDNIYLKNSICQAIPKYAKEGFEYSLSVHFYKSYEYYKNLTEKNDFEIIAHIETNSIRPKKYLEEHFKINGLNALIINTDEIFGSKM